MAKALRRALGALLGAFVRLWLSTVRLTLVLDPALRSPAGLSPPWVLALWHGQQMLLLRWVQRRGTAVLVSLSKDGELLAGALPVLGYAVERGSSSRGGAQGLRAIVRRLRRGLDAAFAVDGPKGPRRVVRAGASASGMSSAPGAAVAARLAGGVVVPMAAACSASWVLSRTWDRFEIPRPFSRVAIVLGAPLMPDEASPSAVAAAIERSRAAAEACLVTRPGGRAAARTADQGASAGEAAAPEVLL